VKSEHRKFENGFSLVELAIVVVIILLLVSLALPSVISSMRAFRAAADSRSIAAQLNLTKMRAANGFTQARLNCDTTANSCRVETCTTKGASTCTTFTAEGETIKLSPGSSFSFGSLTTPAGSQTSIQNTAQILFSSRSLPVDSSGAATGNYALYLTNSSGNQYAGTVYASGKIAMWRYGSGAWTAQ
jgi:prepilin-type N-terminal cleavage/methylation domain-containing protein